MLIQAQSIPAEGAELLGEWHPLLIQLGSVEGLVTLSMASATLGRGPIDSLEALSLFLNAYRSEVLLPVELPSIYHAYRYSRRNQTRELVALDQEVGGRQLFRDFASASQRVGKEQLRRLRPLRDERVVQRYLQAVDRDEAQGWHTLVYGLTLAIYSLPLRQGLMNYARRMLSGFIHAAARSLRLSEKDCRSLVEGLCQGLPVEISSTIIQASLKT